MKTKKLAAIGLAGVLALAACGSDDDDAEQLRRGSSLEAPADDTEATLRVWLNGPDTPDEMIELAKDEFAEQYPNVTVEVERQEWDGLVNRLDTVLPTEDSPDIFEVGNTQAQSYEAAGAMVDLTEFKEDLGGDDLVDSLVEAGTYDGPLLRRALLRRRPHRGLPQGPLRGVGPAGPDDAAGVRRRRQEAQGRQRRHAQLLGHLLPGAQLAGDAVVHLGRRW